jgi:hypothetical protein
MTSRTTQFFMTRDEVVEFFTDLTSQLNLTVVGPLPNGRLGIVDLAAIPDSRREVRAYFSSSPPSQSELSTGIDRPHSVGWVRLVLPHETDHELSMADIAYKTDDPNNPAHKLFSAPRRRVLKKVKFGGFDAAR